jgi:hypothetical protein
LYLFEGICILIVDCYIKVLEICAGMKPTIGYLV